MIRYFIVILLIFVLFPAEITARDYAATRGKMLVTEITGEKKDKEQVVFTIKANEARIDTGSKIYYIVELDTQKAFLVNPRRKTITLMYSKNILEHELPPLQILKDKISLKSYLTEINAHFETVIVDGPDRYEKWVFNIGPVFYIVKIKLPEYFPHEVEITSNDRKTIVRIEEKEFISPELLSEDYFTVPQDFNLVDLISK
jgi:hypothetical protein